MKAMNGTLNQGHAVIRRIGMLCVVSALILAACAQQPATNPAPDTTPVSNTSPSPTPDTTHPSVSIVTPLNNNVVSGTLTVSATATDNVGVVGVQFELDGVNLGTEDKVAPYSISWNTTQTTNGTHLLNAVARDAAGNTASTGVTVSVNNFSDTQAPAVPTKLTASPVSSSQINLGWASSTDNIGVTGYKVYRGGVQIATTATTSYSNTGLAASTTYSYSVSAFDAAGNVSAQTSPVQATTPGSSRSYSTNFDGTENPISEGGAWSHAGLDWTTVQTSGGIAYGTQTGTDGYDDSYAKLSGFPPDQTASGVIHLVNPIDGSCSHEVELLMRWTDSAHSAQGYEVNLSFDGGYAQIVRWNGAIGNFAVLGGGSFPELKEGDVFKASMIGNVITAYVNDIQVAQVTDAAYSTGNPGIGFFRRNCGTNADFGFTSFTATSF
jgi:chitodextrinase